MIRRVFFAVALLAVPAAASAFDFNSTPGKLPKDVTPTAYTIAIAPNVDAKTFAGSETVELAVRKPASRIVLNTLGITISSATVDGTAVASITPDEKQQITTMALAAPLGAGSHELKLVFAGKIRTDNGGLFLQEYTNADGSRGRMLSTQFESTDARSMFPCWDEPSFRATFQLTATLPAAWKAVSNMPIASDVASGTTHTVAFGRTPKMASYLVVLSAGDLARIAQKTGGVEHGVWAVRGREEQGRYTLESSPKILGFYDRYFGIDYPLPKLDHIAVPGGFSGAMENWGGITYNDQIILLTPQSLDENRQENFSIVAHEMAHQWTGDLVTMAWWDDIWLNESFASWMAAKSTDAFNPSWKWYERQDGTKESAMRADARRSVHAIEQHIVDEQQAEASFDGAITYDKGEVVLRMVEDYLGADTFRAGMRRYFRQHEYSNATREDLWTALSQASGKNVAPVADSWVTQPGFPLISIAASCAADGTRTLAMTQARFLADGTAAPGRWAVPMHVASGNAPAQTLLFTGPSMRTAAGRCGEPLRANVGATGYYRVAYDAKTLAADTKAFETLPALDRIGLLDDQWALALAGKASLDDVMALVGRMKTDRDLTAWQRALGDLGTLERYERGTPGHDAFVRLARSLVRPVYDALGFDGRADDTIETRQLRRAVVTSLGVWGDPAVIAAARRRFDAGNLSAEAQSVVLPIVGTWADAVTFDKLVAMLKDATDDSARGRILAAIASVADGSLLDRVYAEVTGPDVPPQLDGRRVGLVLETAARHPREAWTYYTAHIDDLYKTTSSFSRNLGFATTVPEVFALGVPPAELDAFTAKSVPASLEAFLARGKEQAAATRALATKLVPLADHYVAAHPAG